MDTIMIGKLKKVIGECLLNSIFKRSVSVFHPLCKKINKNSINILNNEVKIKVESPFIFKASHASSHDRNSLKSVNIEVPFIYQAPKLNFLSCPASAVISETKQKECVYIIQPNFKWGKHRHLTKLCEWRLDEAISLINSIEHWKVNSTCFESIHEYNPKIFFGSGKLMELSDRIGKLVQSGEVSAVFINTGKLTSQQLRELQAALGCKVFDRYQVVLDLFKERACTKEAKLQMRLAEIHYIRSHLSSDETHYDQQRGGGKMMSGAGETSTDKQRRALNLEESKIKKVLLHIRDHHNQIKNDRLEKHFPHVAMVGYTNAGKTTLTKCLSQDSSLAPEDKLFATLDSTAHRGKLPCGLSIIYMDTVGFISDLPHELVESFSTTLDDLKTADLLLHISDCSHPEFELQMETVMNVLSKLNLPENLLTNMIHVFNKVDLRNTVFLPMHPYKEKDVHIVSAIHDIGLDKLRLAIEEKVLNVTNRSIFNIRLDQMGNELNWLYHNATVVKTIAHEDGSLDVTTILDNATRCKFEKHFRRKIVD